MAWIESHQSLRHHPKLIELAAALGADPAHACGHLHFLWYSVLDYAQDGDVTRFSAAVVARWAGWTQDPQSFYDALLASGWLDTEGDTVAVHDWWEYAGKYVAKKIKDAERKRAAQEKFKADADLQRSSDGSSEESRRNLPTNQPVPTNQPTKEVAVAPSSVLSKEGHRLTAAYPEARRSTDGETMRVIKSIIKPAGKTVDFAISRIQVWEKSDQWLSGRVPRLGKFFSEHTWLADPPPPRGGSTVQPTTDPREYEEGW